MNIKIKTTLYHSLDNSVFPVLPEKLLIRKSKAKQSKREREKRCSSFDFENFINGVRSSACDNDL